MRRALAAAACAVLLAGCGGGSSDSSADPSPTPSPTASGTAPAEEPAFDLAVLDDLAADAEAKGSTCFAVARQGELVDEWYWDAGGEDVEQEVFSVTKSVTSTLVGLAQADGRLSIDDKASRYVDAWRGTDSADVTVRDLLANVSGRFWSNESDYGSLIQAPDRTAYAVGLEQAQPPGTTWVYNNAAIQTLDAVLRAATGQDPASYAQERLFGPLGMTKTFMTPDASGSSTNVFFGLHSTCRDLLRFGMLFAQHGNWDGEQLLPSEWVDAATGASSQELNAGYGYLWWLNRPGQVVDAQGGTAEGQAAPGAPEDLYAAVGLGGQVVMVDPGSQTVVVRLAPLQNDDYGIADAARVVTDALLDEGGTG